MSAISEIYSIPQGHSDFRDTIRQIALERIAPRAGEMDEPAEYPHDLRKLRMMRDAKITQIYEGTNEIQRLVTARTMR